MTTKPRIQCSNPDCYMDAALLLNDVPYCVADYRAANGGRII